MRRLPFQLSALWCAFLRQPLLLTESCDSGSRQSADVCFSPSCSLKLAHHELNSSSHCLVKGTLVLIPPIWFGSAPSFFSCLSSPPSSLAFSPVSFFLCRLLPFLLPAPSRPLCPSFGRCHDSQHFWKITLWKCTMSLRSLTLKASLFRFKKPAIPQYNNQISKLVLEWGDYVYICLSNIWMIHVWITIHIFIVV